MLRPGHFVRLITSNLLATADFVVCELVTLKVAAAERSARPDRLRIRDASGAGFRGQRRNRNGFGWREGG